MSAPSCDDVHVQHVIGKYQDVMNTLARWLADGGTRLTDIHVEAWNVGTQDMEPLLALLSKFHKLQCLAIHFEYSNPWPSDHCFLAELALDGLLGALPRLRRLRIGYTGEELTLRANAPHAGVQEVWLDGRVICRDLSMFPQLRALSVATCSLISDMFDGMDALRWVNKHEDVEEDVDQMLAAAKLRRVRIISLDAEASEIGAWVLDEVAAGGLAEGPSKPKSKPKKKRKRSP